MGKTNSFKKLCCFMALIILCLSCVSEDKDQIPEELTLTEFFANSLDYVADGLREAKSSFHNQSKMDQLFKEYISSNLTSEKSVEALSHYESQNSPKRIQSESNSEGTNEDNTFAREMLKAIDESGDIDQYLSWLSNSQENILESDEYSVEEKELLILYLETNIILMEFSIENIDLFSKSGSSANLTLIGDIGLEAQQGWLKSLWKCLGTIFVSKVEGFLVGCGTGGGIGVGVGGPVGAAAGCLIGGGIGDYAGAIKGAIECVDED